MYLIHYLGLVIWSFWAKSNTRIGFKHTTYKINMPIDTNFEKLISRVSCCIGGYEAGLMAYQLYMHLHRVLDPTIFCIDENIEWWNFYIKIVPQSSGRLGFDSVSVACPPGVTGRGPIPEIMLMLRSTLVDTVRVAGYIGVRTFSTFDDVVRELYRLAYLIESSDTESTLEVVSVLDTMSDVESNISELEPVFVESESEQEVTAHVVVFPVIANRYDRFSGCVRRLGRFAQLFCRDKH